LQAVPFTYLKFVRKTVLHFVIGIVKFHIVLHWLLFHFFLSFFLAFYSLIHSCFKLFFSWSTSLLLTHHHQKHVSSNDVILLFSFTIAFI
jgi:Fe2+ transport system protein B